MRMNLKNLLWLLAAVICFASCSKEDIIEKVAEIPEGKILVDTEIVIDGVVQSDTRAVSEAGYTTGDGLYDKGDPVTVAAFANEGYELVTFYDKKAASINLGSSYDFPAEEPRTFKAEFARKYTITVSANPTAGGTVAGGGTYRGGKTCTLTATANAGYVFDGWYEGSTKVSSDTNYSFTVSSNRTITGKFDDQRYIIVGDKGNIITPFDIKQIGTKYLYDIIYNNGRYIAVGGSLTTGSAIVATSTNLTDWTTTQMGAPSGEYRYHEFRCIAYGNGRYVTTGGSGWTATSTDGITWTGNLRIGSYDKYAIAHGNGRFVTVGRWGFMNTSTDGVNWSWDDVAITSNRDLLDIIYAKGMFIAVGPLECVITSIDGLNWTTRTDYRTHTWKSITYGNGKFVVVANEGYTSTSTDGITWTPPIKIVGSTNWQEITYVKDNFIAVGTNGYMATSTDGSNWSAPIQIKDKQGNPINVNLYGICNMP